jgi:hypothetical protein
LLLYFALYALPARLSIKNTRFEEVNWKTVRTDDFMQSNRPVIDKNAGNIYSYAKLCEKR